MTSQGKQFLRRHIRVQAVQFTGKNYFEIQAFINGRDPDLKTDIAKQKWEEYCDKCAKAGGVQIPSSLGYDPTYSLALPGDYVLSPEPGVFTVMGKENFEAQYMAPEEITDVSGVNALAEGYGPLDFGRYREKIVSEPDATTFNGGRLLSDSLGPGGHASVRLQEYVENHIHAKLGLELAQYLKLDEDTRQAVLWVCARTQRDRVEESIRSMMGFAGVMSAIKSISPADIVADTESDPTLVQAQKASIDRLVNSMRGHFLPTLTQDQFDALSAAITHEHERAIRQRDRYLKTGVSTASHGGSHDTCFDHLLRQVLKIRPDESGEGEAEADALQSSTITTQFDPLTQKTLDEVVQSRKSDFPVGRNVLVRPEVNLTGAKLEKIARREELDALMKEPGRFDADTALFRGHTVNWYALVAEGNGVQGVLGELVGFRRRDKNSVWADIAFPIGEDDQAVIVLKDISAVFLAAESAQDFNAREIILCRPAEGERIVELMNAQVNRARATTPKLAEAPTNVTPLFNLDDSQARPNHSVWTLDDLGKLSSDITRLLMPSLAGVENGKTYRFTLWMNRSGSAVNLRSLFEPAHSEEPVRDELDRAGEIIRSFIGRQFPMTVTEDTALDIATHRHYKGGLYYKLFEARHTENEEDLTIYLHVYPHAPGAYARPVEMFNGKNDDGAERFTAL